MKKAIDDINEIIGEDKLQQNEMSNEFTHIMFGKKFIVSNRAYRDDTNSEDVEEALYKFACRNFN